MTPKDGVSEKTETIVRDYNLSIDEIPIQKQYVRSTNSSKFCYCYQVSALFSAQTSRSESTSLTQQQSLSRQFFPSLWWVLAIQSDLFTTTQAHIMALMKSITRFVKRKRNILVILM